jgi:acyl CoA:acetate/3-ketoacid CoA transferase alpha subunit
MACKIAELDQLVREIPDGAEIALGSFAIARNPIAFANELIRQKKRNLKIYGIIGSMTQICLWEPDVLKSIPMAEVL